jgi:ABC-type amino acid transport system permease subunit
MKEHKMELSAEKMAGDSARPTGRVKRRAEPVSGKLFANLILLLIGAFFVIPVLWLVVGAVDKHAGWQIQMPTLTLDNFVDALAQGNAQALWNSVIVSTIASLVSTGAGILAAYSFSRHRIPWKGPILLGILFLSGVPVTILIVPVYKMFAKFDMLSIVPTAVLLGVTSLPFAIYLIKTTIDAIPRDLEEAASMEQAGTFRILRGHLQLRECMGQLSHSNCVDCGPVEPTRAHCDLQLHWLRNDSVWTDCGFLHSVLNASHRSLLRDVPIFQGWIFSQRRGTWLSEARKSCGRQGCARSSDSGCAVAFWSVSDANGALVRRSASEIRRVRN